MQLSPPDILKLLGRIDAFAEHAPNEVKAFFDSKIWHARARRELGRDLRDLSLRRDRTAGHEPIFESIRPLGLVGHILPGNSQWTPLLAILESAVVGNTAWVKLPTGSDPAILQQQLKQLGLENSVAVFTSRTQAQAMYRQSDAISAWGSESSLEEIRNNLSPQTRFIPWGHRLSFAYLPMWKGQAQKLAQAVVKYEQQACSSPQLVYLEGASFEQACAFAQEVAAELEKLGDNFPQLDDATWAELSNFTQTHRAESCLRQKKVIEGQKQEYRLVVDSEPTFEPSVLQRTLFIKIIQKGQLVKELAPYRRLLQTTGLHCRGDELGDYANMLFEAGVSRVCALESMQDAHPLEPHDGEFSLARFVKRVAVHAPDCGLNVLTSARHEEAPTGEITTKNDFSRCVSSKADYFFKSGGSTSKAILSPFELEDYHLQMQVAADGLIAAGLDPRHDRCMNVFYGGGLYGGFLSFTDILEKCRATQYPMAGYLEHDFVLDTIIEQNINVLLGMPSYLMTLFKLAHERKLRLPVEKVFFGGEPFSPEQLAWLKLQGVKLIKSASYGSVDAGPIGYQCAHSEGGVHHINSTIQKIEIVALDSDRPCKADEVGRVLITSKARRSVAINRYQIGDSAKWLEGTCPCGDPSARLELIGRIGDIFKIGGSFINARKLMALSQGGPFQIQLSIKNLKDHMRIICQDEPAGFQAKLLTINDLHEVCVLEKSVSIEVCNDGFIHASSGKLPLVVEQRR